MFWYKKTAISFFVALYPYLSLIVAKIRFSMLVKKLRCWTFISEKKCFCFVIAKRRCTQFYTTKHMFWFACCNSGLFQCYCTKKRFSSSMQRFTLIFTWFYSNKGFPFFWRSYPVSELSFRGQPSSLFSWPNYTLDTILPKKCFGLLATKLGYLYPYDTKKSVTFFLCLKYAVFSFIAGETCFGLFSVKLGGFQRYCTGKMFSASLQRVTLIFTWFH